MNLVAIEGSCKRQGTGIGGGGRCICRGDGIVIINEGSRGSRKELVFGDEVGSLTGRNKRMPIGWFIVGLDGKMDEAYRDGLSLVGRTTKSVEMEEDE